MTSIQDLKQNIINLAEIRGKFVKLTIGDREIFIVFRDRVQYGESEYAIYIEIKNDDLHLDTLKKNNPCDALYAYEEHQGYYSFASGPLKTIGPTKMKIGNKINPTQTTTMIKTKFVPVIRSEFYLELSHVYKRYWSSSNPDNYSDMCDSIMDSIEWLNSKPDSDVAP
jgi:hypothetical protein